MGCRERGPVAHFGSKCGGFPTFRRMSALPRDQIFQPNNLVHILIFHCCEPLFKFCGRARPPVCPSPFASTRVQPGAPRRAPRQRHVRACMTVLDFREEVKLVARVCVCVRALGGGMLAAAAPNARVGTGIFGVVVQFYSRSRNTGCAAAWRRGCAPRTDGGTGVATR